MKILEADRGSEIRHLCLVRVLACADFPQMSSQKRNAPMCGKDKTQRVAREREFLNKGSQNAQV